MLYILFCYLLFFLVLFFTKHNFIYLFIYSFIHFNSHPRMYLLILERKEVERKRGSEGEGKRERERNIDWLPPIPVLTCPDLSWPGIKSTTFWCVRKMLQPSHSARAEHFVFICVCNCIHYYSTALECCIGSTEGIVLFRVSVPLMMDSYIIALPQIFHEPVSFSGENTQDLLAHADLN